MAEVILFFIALTGQFSDIKNIETFCLIDRISYKLKELTPVK
jgi:hypothetical protein